ncbi:hypothetical protein EDB83DRAFT_2409984 [Lactarius deliciosus]|nr:hypothetical protein EDB83DRAFT_2409984 [Lactarius deliciosus]
MLPRTWIASRFTYRLLFFFIFAISCYQDVVKTYVLRYVALLRLHISSALHLPALHLHLCRSSRFWYYLPRAYSKTFVGGLSWDTNDHGLRNHFSEFGEVDACTIVRDADGRSRGFAFLTFEDPAFVNVVMIPEHLLDGRAVRIDPKRAIPR